MSDRASLKRKTVALLFLTCLITLSGCNMARRHMHEQPRYEPMEQSTFFADGLVARPVPANTIPRGKWGQIQLNEHLYTGKVGGEFATTFPITVDEALLARGQARYDIFCAPCHSRVGDGQGMIVQRGFVQPSSFHIDRLRDEPVGYYYDVISNGFGAMYSYDSRIPPEDRWAIVAYIRALQLSQNARLENVPDSERPSLDAQSQNEREELWNSQSYHRNP